jgi:hypothetical protein
MRSGFMNSYQAVLSPAGIWSMRSITPIPLGIPIESSTWLEDHSLRRLPR